MSILGLAVWLSSPLLLLLVLGVKRVIRRRRRRHRRLNLDQRQVAAEFAQIAWHTPDLRDIDHLLDLYPPAEEEK